MFWKRKNSSCDTGAVCAWADDRGGLHKSKALRDTSNKKIAKEERRDKFLKEKAQLQKYLTLGREEFIMNQHGFECRCPEPSTPSWMVRNNLHKREMNSGEVAEMLLLDWEWIESKVKLIRSYQDES